MHMLAEHLVNVLVSQRAQAGRVAERASVLEIDPINGLGGGVENKSEFVFTFTPCLFSLLSLGYIDTGSDITDKGAILIKPWHSNVENPSILSVVPPKPVLHSELLTTIKSLRVRPHTSLQIVRVNALGPAVPEFGVNGPPGKIQPGLVEVGAEFV